MIAVRGGLPGSDDAFDELRAPSPPMRGTPPDRAVVTREVQHVLDVETDPSCNPRFREQARRRGFRSGVWVPMLRGNDAVGVIAVCREQTGGFAPAEIALIETFADQAVIAIENARLLNELQSQERRPQRGPGAADGYRRDPARHQHLTDGHPARAGHGGQERRPLLRSRRCRDLHPATGEAERRRSPRSHPESSRPRDPGRARERGRAGGARTGARSRARSPGRGRGVPGGQRPGAGVRLSDHAGRSAAPGRRGRRHDQPPARRDEPVHGQADRAAEDLRQPGRHRHRERASVHRAGGAQRRATGRPRAADGDRRSAQGDQPLDVRPAAGAPDPARERHPAGRGGRGTPGPARGRRVPIRRGLRNEPRVQRVLAPKRRPAGTRLADRAGRAREPDGAHRGRPGRPGIRATRGPAGGWLSIRTGGSPSETGRAGGRVHHVPHRGAAIHRPADRARHHLCRSGRHRHRERAPTHRAAGQEHRPHRGARAADCHQRDPPGDLELSDRRAAGLRGDRRECSPALRRHLQRRVSRRGGAAQAVSRARRERGRRGRPSPGVSDAYRSRARPPDG